MRSTPYEPAAGENFFQSHSKSKKMLQYILINGVNNMQRLRALKLLVGHIEFTGNRLPEWQFTKLMEDNNITYPDIIDQLKPQTLRELLVKHHIDEAD